MWLELFGTNVVIIFSSILVWKYYIPIAKRIIYTYETSKDLNIPIGLTLVKKDDSGFFHYNYRERPNGSVYSFISKESLTKRITHCPVISAELILDEREGIDITEFIIKIAGPNGNGYESWTPEEIANYLNIEYIKDVKITLFISESYKSIEFSGQELLALKKE